MKPLNLVVILSALMFNIAAHAEDFNGDWNKLFAVVSNFVSSNPKLQAAILRNFDAGSAGKCTVVAVAVMADTMKGKKINGQEAASWAMMMKFSEYATNDYRSKGTSQSSLDDIQSQYKNAALSGGWPSLASECTALMNTIITQAN